MTDHDFHHLAAAYALDALDADERAMFESHLGSCDECRAEVDEFRVVHASMAQATAVAPPPALKATVLDEVSRTRQQPPVVHHTELPADLLAPSPQRRRWPTVALAVAAAAALVVVAVAVFARDDRSDPFAAELATVLEQPDAQMLELDEQPNDSGRFKVAWSESLHRAVLIGEELATAPSGKAYELWLITPDQSMAMHVLDPASDGNVHAALDMPQPPAKWAITVEPSEGAEVATGEIIFIGTVS